MKKQFLGSLIILATFTIGSCGSDSSNNVESSNNITTESSAQANNTENTPAQNIPTTKVEVEEAFHDFGQLKEGVLAKKVYKIKNIGTEPLLINDVRPDCGCTVPAYSKKPVIPNESAEIEIEFNTTGKVGNHQKNVTVISNADQEVKLSFKAEVVK